MRQHRMSGLDRSLTLFFLPRGSIAAMGCCFEPRADSSKEFDRTNGHLERQGILWDYPELCGITFVRPSWNEPSKLLSIWNPTPDQTHLINKFTLQEHEVEGLIDRYSDGWNDTRNEHGWNYRICR
jgi:hypothetical protein